LKIILREWVRMKMHESSIALWECCLFLLDKKWPGTRNIYINATETNYLCNNQSVTFGEYNVFRLNNSASCSTDNTQLDICYCPKDYNGLVCENKIRTICKFETLILNGQDLYKNYNTFYDEYLNNTFSSPFDKVMTLNYDSTLRCITPGANEETYYYTNPKTTVKHR